jgi:hypothetical protein
MDSYIDIKVKNLPKYKTKVICVSSKVKEIPSNDSMVDEFLIKYKETILQNPKSVIFLDTRGVEKISVEMIWSKIGKFTSTLDPIAKTHITLSVIFVSNANYKIIINSILKIYPSVVPCKICSENSEGMNFIEKVLGNK